MPNTGFRLERVRGQDDEGGCRDIPHATFIWYIFFLFLIKPVNLQMAVN
jgi:hypothetical protein